MFDVPVFIAERNVVFVEAAQLSVIPVDWVVVVPIHSGLRRDLPYRRDGVIDISVPKSEAERASVEGKVPIDGDGIDHQMDRPCVAAPHVVNSATSASVKTRPTTRTRDETFPLHQSSGVTGSSAKRMASSRSVVPAGV